MSNIEIKLADNYNMKHFHFIADIFMKEIGTNSETIFGVCPKELEKIDTYQIYLYVRCSNIGAINLYSKCGFIVDYIDNDMYGSNTSGYGMFKRLLKKSKK